MTFGHDDRWSEDSRSNKDWDHKRSRTSVSDLSEMLLSRKKTENSHGNINSGPTVDAREKIKAKNAAKNNGVKSRLGSVVAPSAERKRKLELNVAPGTKRPASGILNLKQSISEHLKENDRKTLRHETFIEKKAKTGEAMAWDSKLCRPRMGMVADMTDSRVSAKNRLHQSGNQAKTEDVIKRVIPNQKPKPATAQDLRSGMFRNVVLTEVVEEEEDPINIKRTVTNDYDEEMEEDGGGFFQDRIVKTRDTFTELKIKQQKTVKQKPAEYDLETDAGNDLPDLGSFAFRIEVRNSSPAPAPERPKLEAKRSLETKKSKQRREVMLELQEMKHKEREKVVEREMDSKKRRDVDSRERKRDEEESRNKRREEIERRRADTERKRIRELEAKRQEEEKKFEELKRKNEELNLEQQLKKKEEMLKVEEEERKIAELQRQEELMKNKLKLLERQKEVEREKHELERIRLQKEKDAEASLQKKENEARIKQEIAIIEEQESKIRERQKQLQKKKIEKKKEIQSHERKSKARRKRRYSSDDSSSSESNDSDSDSSSSSEESDSQSSDSDSQDSEHDLREKRKRENTKAKSTNHPSRSKNQKVGKEIPKENRKISSSSSSRDSLRHREDRKTEGRSEGRSQMKSQDRYQDKYQDSADRKRSSEVTKESGDLKDKLKSYLNRARAKSRDRDVRDARN